MPEFSPMQIRMLALDHAIKMSAPGERPEYVINAAREYEEYILSANKTPEPTAEH